MSRGAKPRPIRTRFEEKYIPEPMSGCWLWVAKTDRAGYGRIWDGANSASAHRISWRLHRRDCPDGLSVCHTCDTPSCVNPDHLFLGTHAENMADMSRKGRAAGPRILCRRGHSMSASNVYARQSGHRECRICRRERDASKGKREGSQ